MRRLSCGMVPHLGAGPAIVRGARVHVTRSAPRRATKPYRTARPSPATGQVCWWSLPSSARSRVRPRTGSRRLTSPGRPYSQPFNATRLIALESLTPPPFAPGLSDRAALFLDARPRGGSGKSSAPARKPSSGLAVFGLCSSIMNMGPPRARVTPTNDGLLQAARGGLEWVLATLVQRHRLRLERMCELRMARRLPGRVDAANGVQVSSLALRSKSPEHSGDPQLPFCLWLRLEVGQKLVDPHRFHVRTQMRDAGHGSRCTRGCRRRRARCRRPSTCWGQPCGHAGGGEASRAGGAKWHDPPRTAMS
jgi:hypothetical protein